MRQLSAARKMQVLVLAAGASAGLLVALTLILTRLLWQPSEPPRGWGIENETEVSYTVPSPPLFDQPRDIAKSLLSLHREIGGDSAALKFIDTLNIDDELKASLLNGLVMQVQFSAKGNNVPAPAPAPASAFETPPAEAPQLPNFDEPPEGIAPVDKGQVSGGAVAKNEASAAADTLVEIKRRAQLLSDRRKAAETLTQIAAAQKAIGETEEALRTAGLAARALEEVPATSEDAKEASLPFAVGGVVTFLIVVGGLFAWLLAKFFQAFAEQLGKKAADGSVSVASQRFQPKSSPEPVTGPHS